MSERPHVALTPRPLTITEVDARLENAIARKAEAEPLGTPESAEIVGACDRAIDRLLALRFTLMEDAS